MRLRSFVLSYEGWAREREASIIQRCSRKADFLKGKVSPFTMGQALLLLSVLVTGSPKHWQLWMLLLYIEKRGEKSEIKLGYSYFFIHMQPPTLSPIWTGAAALVSGFCSHPKLLNILFVSQLAEFTLTCLTPISVGESTSPVWELYYRIVKSICLNPFIQSLPHLKWDSSDFEFSTRIYDEGNQTSIWLQICVVKNCKKGIQMPRWKLDGNLFLQSNPTVISLF